MVHQHLKGLGPRSLRLTSRQRRAARRLAMDATDMAVLSILSREAVQGPARIARVLLSFAGLAAIVMTTIVLGLRGDLAPEPTGPVASLHDLRIAAPRPKLPSPRRPDPPATAARPPPAFAAQGRGAVDQLGPHSEHAVETASIVLRPRRQSVRRSRAASRHRLPPISPTVQIAEGPKLKTTARPTLDQQIREERIEAMAAIRELRQR